MSRLKILTLKDKKCKRSFAWSWQHFLFCPLKRTVSLSIHQSTSKSQGDSTICSLTDRLERLRLTLTMFGMVGACLNERYIQRLKSPSWWWHQRPSLQKKTRLEQRKFTRKIFSRKFTRCLWRNYVQNISVVNQL